MENIYTACQRCNDGKISHYPAKNKTINIVLIIIACINLYFVLGFFSKILQAKLQDIEVPINDPNMIGLLISGGILAIIGACSHYFYNIIQQLRSWLSKDCPYCEDGYIIKIRTSMFSSIVYFFDLLIFEQILIPMFQALTYTIKIGKSKLGTSE